MPVKPERSTVFDLQQNTRVLSPLIATTRFLIRAGPEWHGVRGVALCHAEGVRSIPTDREEGQRPLAPAFWSRVLDFAWPNWYGVPGFPGFPLRYRVLIYLAEIPAVFLQ